MISESYVNELGKIKIILDSHLDFEFFLYVYGGPINFKLSLYPYIPPMSCHVL